MHKLLIIFFLFISSFVSGIEVLLITDSIGRDWNVQKSFPMILQELCNEERDDIVIINDCIPGSVTYSGPPRLKKQLLAHNPQVVFLLLGTNDVALLIQRQYTEPYLRKMIEMCKKRGCKIILGQLEPTAFRTINKNTAFSRQFEDLYLSLAKEYQVLYMPYLTAGIAIDPDATQDGVHPTQKTHYLLAKIAKAYLDQALESTHNFTLDSVAD